MSETSVTTKPLGCEVCLATPADDTKGMHQKFNHVRFIFDNSNDHYRLCTCKHCGQPFIENFHETHWVHGEEKIFISWTLLLEAELAHINHHYPEQLDSRQFSELAFRQCYGASHKQLTRNDDGHFSWV